MIGAKLSLISKSEIRYEGVLYTIDTNESTIALQNGACAHTVRQVLVTSVIAAARTIHATLDHRREGKLYRQSAPFCVNIDRIVITAFTSVSS